MPFLSELSKILIFSRMNDTVTHQMLYDVWRESARDAKYENIFHFLMDKIGWEGLSEVQVQRIRVSLRSLLQRLEIRWEKAHRMHICFQALNASWLQSFLNVTGLEHHSAALLEQQPSTSRLELLKCLY